ncbi:MAG: type VI secretion system tip protein VgrG [Sandaracinaceae bacterium]|nr:type VI secretion system tip protein VgrG [Sandaracinaceae bacterium]
MTEWLFELESRSSEISPEDLVLTRVEGVETLSDLYRYELSFTVVGDAGLSPEIQQDLLRNPCRVRFGRVEDPEEVHGRLCRIRMHSAETARDARFTATLVPRLWTTTMVHRSRVFQDLDVLGIVQAVLAEHGLRPDEGLELRTEGDYPTSEYTVQYQETDFDFINRLMEHFGVYYFFRQLPDGESMVVVDGNRGLDRRFADDPEPVQYFRRDLPPGSQAAVHSLERVVEPRPQGVVLRDYNWRTPTVQLHSEAPCDAVTGVGFHNHYGEHYKSPGEGAFLAQLRAEGLLADQERYAMETTIPHLAPGHRFELTGHPFGEMDQEYAVTSVRRRAVQGEHADEARSYAEAIEAIPYRVTYRPPLRTARPRILGLMHGHVDGEVPGTAAPIDEYGRYKVLLPFDLVGEGGGKASRWIRLAQAASGPGFGIHFPLHIGVEVAIAHVDGDPDRPIIVASPPNAETITPVNRDNATQSKIRTQTGIRITFDDDVQ